MWAPAFTVPKRHQVLSVGGSINGVMVQRVLLSGNGPAESLTGHRSRNGQAVIDAGFDLGSFLVIVPGRDLDVAELIACGIVIADIGQGRQPCLSALLVE